MPPIEVLDDMVNENDPPTNKNRSNNSIEYFTLGIEKQEQMQIDTKQSLRRLRTEAESKLGQQTIGVDETIS